MSLLFVILFVCFSACVYADARHFGYIALVLTRVFAWVAASPVRGGWGSTLSVYQYFAINRRPRVPGGTRYG